MKAIREVALLWNFTDVRSAEAHCKSRGEDLAKHCTSLFRAKRVPIIHNMKTPALLQLAIDVLLPLSLGSTELTLQDVPDALESKTKLPERCSPHDEQHLPESQVLLPCSAITDRCRQQFLDGQCRTPSKGHSTAMSVASIVPVSV